MVCTYSRISKVVEHSVDTFSSRQNENNSFLLFQLAEVPDVGRDNLIVRIWHKKKRHLCGLLLVNDL